MAVLIGAALMPQLHPNYVIELLISVLIDRISYYLIAKRFSKCLVSVLEMIVL